MVSLVWVCILYQSGLSFVPNFGHNCPMKIYILAQCYMTDKSSHLQASVLCWPCLELRAYCTLKSTVRVCTLLKWTFWYISFILGNPPLPNPYGDPSLTQPIMPLQQLVAEILFVRTSYVKKIIEDCSNSEETIKLLRFCCWENPQFSSTVLSELLWQVTDTAFNLSYKKGLIFD